MTGISYEQALAVGECPHRRSRATIRCLAKTCSAAITQTIGQKPARPLRLGRTLAILCHRLVADWLHTNARINEAALAGATVTDTDVLVIGGGGAGCAAALTATKAGAKVLVATKLRLGDSNTVMAEAGIQAAVRPEDARRNVTSRTPCAAAISRATSSWWRRW